MKVADGTEGLMGCYSDPDNFSSQIGKSCSPPRHKRLASPVSGVVPALYPSLGAEIGGRTQRVPYAGKAQHVFRFQCP
jgi:hypothetical protein